jgi:hypothetical protein
MFWYEQTIRGKWKWFLQRNQKSSVGWWMIVVEADIFRRVFPSVGPKFRGK